jgi:hypothetical protein
MASPAASNSRTMCCSPVTAGYQRNIVTPAMSDTTTYRQSSMAGGGTAPMSTSRIIPPALPATNARTLTPNTSSRLFTPDAAPLMANTNVPTRSSVATSVAVAISAASFGDERRPQAGSVS